MTFSETIILIAGLAGVGGALALWRGAASRLHEAGRLVESLQTTVAEQAATVDAQRLVIKHMVESLSEGLVALSPKGRVVFANAKAAEMFNTAELVGRSLLEIVRKQAFVASFERALRGESSVERMTLVIGGVQRQVELRVSPVSGSTEIAAVALFLDTSQMERLQRIRRDFLEDFSHEVRTPLAGLRSAAETLDHGSLTAEQEDQLRKVLFRQLSRIERLVKDVSELHRIESGDLVLEKREVDLRTVMRDLCDEFAQRLADKHVRFRIEGGEALATVDPARAQQIFSNLLDNAYKHGGGGEIRVDVASINGHAVVKVSDQGDGIPAQELDRIFNRFYRVDKSRSQHVPGVGLGLAIAKHLVLLHGGTIQAYNRPSGGATFEVRFPRG